MYEGEVHPLELEIYDYVYSYVHFKQYLRMNEDQRKKLIEKFTISCCRAFAPRRRYDIGKDEVRDIVTYFIAVIAEREAADYEQERTIFPTQ